uniref:E2 ubiquitin-conjugating enzyme n=1 Tax=Astyanax mexicanus TaxID=7994 RepID=A0A8B9LPC1_ASTMX
MAHQQMPSSQKALMLELKSLQEEPVEGFRITLVEESDLYNWEVAIFGPPNTLYEGGYFKAHIKFPVDYPYSPPTFRFLTKMWHPNIYENGDVCISILHPPVDDPQSGELPSERWNPTQNVRTILLSVISLLNEPNTFSPANVDASVMFRKWRDSKGKDKEYAEIIRNRRRDVRNQAGQHLSTLLTLVGAFEQPFDSGQRFWTGVKRYEKTPLLTVGCFNTGKRLETLV